MRIGFSDIKTQSARCLHSDLSSHAAFLAVAKNSGGKVVGLGYGGEVGWCSPDVGTFCAGRVLQFALVVGDVQARIYIMIAGPYEGDCGT
jgi:hypothetical protein